MTDQDPRDPFEILRNANPAPGDNSDSVEPVEANMALFEEIIMDNPTPAAAKKAQRATRPAREPMWRRPGAMAVAGAFTVAVVVAGVLVLPGDEQSAYAAVLEAAEQTATSDSGRIEVVIELDELTSEDEDESGVIQMEFVFDGENNSIKMAFEFEGEANDEELLDSVFETRTVDGEDYTFLDPEQGWISFPDIPGANPESLSQAGVFGFDEEQLDPSTMVELVSSARDFDKVDSADGATSYRGSVLGTDIEAIDESKLPAGVSLIATDGGNLPEEVTLTVVVRDGQLSSVVLDADGDFDGNEFTEAGYVDATITTTYAELGEPQTIEAPPVSEIGSLFGGEDEELVARMEILEDVKDRRPELCQEIFDTQFQDEPEITEATAEQHLEDNFAEFNADVVQCFVDAGEPEAAAAWEEMNSFDEGNFDGSSVDFEALDEVEQRRPGLCQDAFDQEPTDEESYEAFNEALVQCYLDAGEPDAAAAWESFNNS